MTMDYGKMTKENVQPKPNSSEPKPNEVKR